MIKTETTQISDCEHRINVTVPQAEYQRLHQEKLNELLAKNIRVSGFRPGKVPQHVVARQYADHLRQQVVSGLLDAHYGTALEQSGLIPAVQPELDLAEPETGGDFAFNILVTSWPDIELTALEELEIERRDVSVDDDDIDGVIQRLMDSQIRYTREDKAIEQGDKAILDYVGYIGDEAFDGGSATDAELVIGSGQYIPGFEEQLEGAKAGDHVQVSVQFPNNYQAGALAGQQARFEVDVKEVQRGEKCANEDELATLLGFDDAAALREDSRQKLLIEAEKAAWEKNRETVEEALLEHHDIEVPQRILDERVAQALKRYQQRLSEQGSGSMSDEQVRAFVAHAREVETENIRLTIIYRALQKQAEMELDEDEVRSEVEKQASRYPESERESYVNWVMRTSEYRSAVESTVMERKCVNYVLSQAKITSVTKTISELQTEIDAEEAPTEA